LADRNAQSALIQNIKNALNIEKMDDWYSVTKQQVLETKVADASALLRLYNFNMSNVLTSIYSDHGWEIWKFSSGVAAELWKNESFQKSYMVFLGSKYGFKKQEDWYNVEVKHFRESKGLGLLKVFNNSPSRAVQQIFSQQEWLPWKFKVSQKNFWSQSENQRRYCFWLFKHLGFEKMEDWYRVSRTDFESHYGVRLLNIYHNRVSDVLKAVFPEHTWDDTKFFRKRRNLADVNVQRKIFDDFAQEHSLNSADAWYNVDPAFAMQNANILTIVSNFYQTSLVNALIKVYSNHSWKPWLFKRAPVGWWKEIPNQRLFFEDAKAKLRIRNMNDWYDVTVQDVMSIGGTVLQYWISSSVFSVLCDTYCPL
jgi:hypothetical protein